MKKFYVVRHGEASRNHPEAPLSPLGIQQSERVADFLKQECGTSVTRLITSPLLRAKQTADIISQKALGDGIKPDPKDNLEELKLGDTTNHSGDIWDHLRKLFENKEYAFPNGESILKVGNRVRELLNELNENNVDNPAILVTHRVTMTLLLHEFDREIGFEHCKNMQNVDVYLVTAMNSSSRVERIWRIPVLS